MTGGFHTVRSTSTAGQRPTARALRSLALLLFGTLALTACGPQSLLGWGANSFGEIGDGTDVGKRSPVVVDAPWRNVSSMYIHSVGVRTDGTLWTWGTNWYGQLGNGTTDDHNVPTMVGSRTDWKTADAGWDFTVAIRTDGTLWEWSGRASSKEREFTSI